MSRTRTTLLNCPADRISRDEILAVAAQAMRKGPPLTIEGLNVAKIIVARRNSSLMAALKAAGIVHLDGAGVALAATLLRQYFPPRRAGIDLMDDLLALAAQERAPVFLLGAKPDIIVRAAETLRERHPSLQLVGLRDGYFSDTEAPAIATEIAASGAKLLLIGISSPKKEQFLHQHGTTCRASVAMGVGGAFDVLAGSIKRAPRWMQRAGLEWCFRLLQEPRRLAWRYARSNTLFALLLARAWWQQQALPRAFLPWAGFLVLLRSNFGEAAANCRHEIYFLHRKRLLGGRLHAVIALLRDLFLLCTAPRHAFVPAHVKTLAVVTLPGASGVGAIARAVNALPRTHSAVTVVHPRIVLPAAALRPARLRVRQVLTALHKALPCLLRTRSKLSRLIVASCMLRSALWQVSWQNFHAANPHLTHALLHNDFDMMSGALVSALSPALEVICVQHGIPTDEFFPARAPVQCVWGESSRAAYHAASPHTTLLTDALGRGTTTAVEAVVPRLIYLLSQTHTPVYGTALAPYFEALAEALAAQLPPEQFCILLHPGEVGQPLYPSIAPEYIARSPHPSLQQSEPRALMVGFASTALLDAARAGHYVAAMEWPATASLAAKQLATPPTLCADAAAVLACFTNLCANAALRAQLQAQQRAWLAATFTDSGELARHVR